MKTSTISIEFYADDLERYTDQHLAGLWHAAQANSKPFDDKEACDLAEGIGREIIRRFLTATQPALYNFQGSHIHSGDDAISCPPANSTGRQTRIVYISPDLHKVVNTAVVAAEFALSVHSSKPVHDWKRKDNLEEGEVHFTQDPCFANQDRYRAPYASTWIDVIKLSDVVDAARTSKVIMSIAEAAGEVLAKKIADGNGPMLQVMASRAK